MRLYYALFSSSFNGFKDLIFYLSRGRMCLIELKRKGDTASYNQITRHKALIMLGFTVHVVVAKTPADGWGQVYDILSFCLKITSI